MPLPDTLRPDSLLKMTLGGVTLTLLQTSAPPPGPPDLTTHFFTEFDATKEGPFGSRDFHHLRPRFQRACPCSHVRYELRPGTEERLLEPLSAPSDVQLLPCRLTGAAVQVSWELRTGRGRRTTSTEVHFGQLEVLECLWPRGAPKPEYTEVKAQGRCGPVGSDGHGLQPDPFTSCGPSQILSFPSSLGSQASARPCAHLRHTQTLRRVSKVTPSSRPQVPGCSPWCFDVPVPASLVPPASAFHPPYLHSG